MYHNEMRSTCKMMSHKVAINSQVIEGGSTVYLNSDLFQIVEKS